MLKYVVCLYKGCGGCSVGIVMRGAVGARVWEFLSCRCCKFVLCVDPVAVLNAALFMTCSLLMQVEDARDDHMK